MKKGRKADRKRRNKGRTRSKDNGEKGITAMKKRHWKRTRKGTWEGIEKAMGKKDKR